MLAPGQPAVASVRDHRRVVRAELRSRIKYPQAAATPERRESLPQTLVCADTACDDERRQPRLLRGARAFRDQRLDDRLLELEGHVRACLLIQRNIARCDDDGRLQSAEAEVQPGTIQ